jgi:hypothetical protein
MILPLKLRPTGLGSGIDQAGAAAMSRQIHLASAFHH